MVSEKPARGCAAFGLLAGALGVLLLVILLGILGFFGYMYLSIYFEDYKGPHRNIATLADLDSDGDLDVIFGHTRWEAPSTSWSGSGVWINQGDGSFRQSPLDLSAAYRSGAAGAFATGTGDLDGDGAADFLLLDGYSLVPMISRAGDFDTLPAIPSPNKWRGHADMGGAVLLGDLNSDGVPDAVVTGCCYGRGGDPSEPNSLIQSFTWVMLSGWTPGGLLAGQTANITALDGLPVRAAALGDLDNDGDLDLFAAVGTATALTPASLADRILLNDGNGGFIDSRQALGSADSYAVALGDLDSDGDLDALVGGMAGVSMWANQGGIQGGYAGLFAPGPMLTSAQTQAIFLADFNADGSLDALVGSKSSARIWFNDGQGAFTDSGQSLSYHERFGLAVGDFDGDGLPDILAGSDAEINKVWLNQGEGKFK